MKLNSIVIPSNSVKFFAVARRKKSVAKVSVFSKGSGKIVIVSGEHEHYIERDALNYFKDQFLVDRLLFPFNLLNYKDMYNVVAHVKGGGLSGQADAIKLGIVRALLQENISIQPVLKSYKLLVRDGRVKERKKIGKYGARRSPQFTKR